MFAAMAEAGEIPAGRQRHGGQRRRDPPAVSRRVVRQGHRRRGARAPARRPGRDERDRAGAAAGRHGRGDRARAGCQSGSAGGCPTTTTTSTGGHVRIFTRRELVTKLTRSGLTGRAATTTRTRCTRRTGGSSARSASTTTTIRWPRAYHKLLVWDIMRKPAVTRLADQALNPLIGKSLVVYADKHAASPIAPPGSAATAALGARGRGDPDRRADRWPPATRSPRCSSPTARSAGRTATSTRWNHVECAMALSVAGLRGRRPARLRVAAAEPARRRLLADEDGRAARST